MAHVGSVPVLMKSPTPITAAGFALLTDNKGEASVRNYVTNGYTILSF